MSDHTLLSCKGTINQLHGLIIYIPTTSMLSTICVSIYHQSIPVHIYRYLSIHQIHLSVHLAICLWAIRLFLIIIIYLSLYHHQYLSINACVYTFMSAIYISRHHLSIHLSLTYLSTVDLRSISYLSIYLSIYPTTIYLSYFYHLNINLSLIRP